MVEWFRTTTHLRLVVLPLLFISFSTTSQVKEFDNYRAIIYRDLRHGKSPGLEHSFQNVPTPLSRLSFLLSFPALVLSYPSSIGFPPMNDLPEVVYENPGRYVFTREHVTFLLWVGISWWIIGTAIGSKEDWISERFRRLRIQVSLALTGCLFGGATLAYAVALISTRSRAWQQVGTGGLIWGVIMVTYFAKRSRMLLRRYPNREDSAGSSHPSST
jgi:hypothetical protein